MEEKKLPSLRLSTLPAVERKAILEDVIRRYQEGESIYEIAPSLGMTNVALYGHLVNGELANEWKDAKISHALHELESAEKELREATEALFVTRARERMRGAQWHLERLLRKLYGSDIPPDLGSRVRISINVAPQQSNPQVTIDGETGQVTDK